MRKTVTAAALEGTLLSARHRAPVQPSAAGFSCSQAEQIERLLVEAAREGDAQASHELYVRYRDRVFNLAAYTLGDRVQAEDVLQNVFMKAFRALSKFRCESSFATWLYRITINECHDHHRSRTAAWVSFEEIQGSGEDLDQNSVTEQSHARRESRAIIQQAVSQLPAKLRAVVALRYAEELSYEEIALVLGCAPGTVASRLSRALAELQSRLRPLKEMLC
jgi:RNA polymerase sigma-70 factor, ECF subfamily